MRLSKGWVEGQRLVCPYHGWSYDLNGEAANSSTPRLRACAQRFEVVERYGLIWVKAFGSAAQFPQISVTDEFQYLCTVPQRIRAPLELVLDSLCELEHTATIHDLFGFDQKRLSEVEIGVELTDETIQLVTTGPHRRIPRLVEWFFGVRNGDRFTTDGTFYFSPVCVFFNQRWSNPTTGKVRSMRLQIAAFLTPINEEETELVFVVNLPSTLLGKFGLHRILKPLVWSLTKYELWQDKQNLENLADKDMTLHGMQLGRFDRILGETRKRIDCIYRGRKPSRNF